MSKWVDKNEWPINVYKAITRDDEATEESLPEDYRGALEYVLISTITDREEQVLRYRYQMALTYRAIGEKFGLQSERIRQIHDKAIRKLRHPARFALLRYGVVAQMERYRESCRELFYNQGYKEGFRNGGMGAQAPLLSNPYQQQEDDSTIPIEEASVDILDLSVRLYNCLRRANISTVGQLLDLSKESLLRIRNLGWHSLQELEMKMEKYNLVLREE